MNNYSCVKKSLCYILAGAVSLSACNGTSKRVSNDKTYGLEMNKKSERSDISDTVDTYDDNRTEDSDGFLGGLLSTEIIPKGSNSLGRNLGIIVKDAVVVVGVGLGIYAISDEASEKNKRRAHQGSIGGGGEGPGGPGGR